MWGRKLQLLFLLFLVYSLFSCEGDKGIYEVKGKLEHVQDSIFFAAREMGDTLYVDTISINQKGEFAFSGKVDTLTVVSLYFRGSSASPYILVDKGWKVNIAGDIKFPDLIAAQGGDINNELTKFKNEHADLLKARREIIHAEGTHGILSDSVLNNKGNSIELKNINFELQNIASEYVKNNPSKISSVILINNFFKNEDSLERLSESLGELKGAAYDFPLAVQLREYEKKVKQSAVGSRAPSFTRKDINGEEVSLGKMRGKYVLLSFSSTTCKICREIFPDIVKEYNKIREKGKNIEFITIIKDIEEHPIPAEQKAGIKWTLIPEYDGWASPIFVDYNIKELPYNILISKDGTILERNVSVYGLNQRLDNYPDINGDKLTQRFKRK